MKTNLQEVIEKRYGEYLEKVKEWDTDLPTGKKGPCDLCTTTDDLTEHHIIPRRMFPKANAPLMDFLEKLTINICSKCHNKLHPENIWKADLIKFQQMFENEPKRLQTKVEGDLLNKEKAVSQAIQDRNNIQVQLTNKLKTLEERKQQINELKESLNKEKHKKRDLTKQFTEKDDILSLFKKDEKREKIDAIIFFNLLKLYSDGDEYRKRLREDLKEYMIKERETMLDRKESVGGRDIKFFLDKLLMMPFLLDDYDEEMLADGGKYLSKVFAEEKVKALHEVFEIPEDELVIIEKAEREKRKKSEKDKGADK